MSRAPRVGHRFALEHHRGKSKRTEKINSNRGIYQEGRVGGVVWLLVFVLRVTIRVQMVAERHLLITTVSAGRSSTDSQPILPGTV